MKKFLLFVSTVILSLLFVNNNAYAQELPDVLIRAPYSDHYYERTNNDTYEYTVEYLFENIFIEEPDTIEYYFVTIYSNQPFYKGYYINNNSYFIEEFYVESDQFGIYTLITLRVTVDIALIEDEYGTSNLYQDVIPFFRDDSALYIKYRISPEPSEYYRGYNDGYEIGYNDGYNEGIQIGEQAGYDEGYSTGYNNGYNNGYNEGYGDGVRVTEPEAYQRGYDDGYEEATNTAVSKFTSNLHVWLVPAIIIVVIAGIFVGYRRERYGGD